MPLNEARSLSGARVMVGWLVDFEAARKQEDVMTRKFGGSFQRIAWLAALTLALPAMSLWPSYAQAQVIVFLLHQADQFGLVRKRPTAAVTRRAEFLAKLVDRGLL